MEKILAVITSWDDAKAVIAEAERLATQFHTGVEVLRPVHSQLGELSKYINLVDFTEMRDDILKVEASLLSTLCAGKSYSQHTEWASRVHSAIVEKAENIGAGLIVMMASHDPLLSVLVHTPDDWHLFRDTPCPVLSMVRDRHANKKVIAAIDALDTHELHTQLSSRVLDNAAAIAKAKGVPLHVLTVVADPALVYAGIANAPMSGDFLLDTKDRAEVNAKALVARLGIGATLVESVIGRVEEVLTQRADNGNALLVMGNSANRGLKGLLLGNTAERILHNMKSDMLVVN